MSSRERRQGSSQGGPACRQEAQITLQGTQRALAGTFQNDEMTAQRESRSYEGGRPAIGSRSELRRAPGSLSGSGHGASCAAAHRPLAASPCSQRGLGCTLSKQPVMAAGGPRLSGTSVPSSCCSPATVHTQPAGQQPLRTSAPWPSRECLTTGLLSTQPRPTAPPSLTAWTVQGRQAVLTLHDRHSGGKGSGCGCPGGGGAAPLQLGHWLLLPSPPHGLGVTGQGAPWEITPLHCVFSSPLLP